MRTTRNTCRNVYTINLTLSDRIYDQRWMYTNNMFIANRKIFTEYMTWLFSIIEEMEKRIDEPDGDDPRIFGFLSERLLNLYVGHNRLKVKEVPMIFINGKNERGKIFNEHDEKINFRYFKRRYTPWIIDVEEKLRHR